MTTLLPVILPAILASGWLTPTEQIQISGQAARYDPGLMGIAAANNGYDLSGYLGGVAVMAKADKGRSLWLRFSAGKKAGQWQGPFLAVDCAQEEHYDGLVARGRVVEVSWHTWQENGLPETPVPVDVRFRPPIPFFPELANRRPI